MCHFSLQRIEKLQQIVQIIVRAVPIRVNLIMGQTIKPIASGLLNSGSRLLNWGSRLLNSGSRLLNWGSRLLNSGQ
ncbi:hypothetical protein NIES2100_41600 [Calothrix sp. NIES-2100]|nr:hypothetical protein NIES2100_41600 [Calothrix sp. NIES-2100]